MYNRYLNADGFDEYFMPIADEILPQQQPQPTEPVQPTAPQQKARGGIGGLLGGLGDKLKLPNFDSDTILLLVLVYFLMTDKDSEDEGGITNTLLIVGALLLLGF